MEKPLLQEDHLKVRDALGPGVAQQASEGKLGYLHLFRQHHVMDGLEEEGVLLDFALAQQASDFRNTVEGAAVAPAPVCVSQHRIHLRNTQSPSADGQSILNHPLRLDLRVWHLL